ncbi:MAG: hypothetical protein LBI39_04090, partial [Puniceicoccales bacterium]|nr:hypothetical protein [Puniceicoccales bacterium]
MAFFAIGPLAVLAAPTARCADANVTRGGGGSAVINLSGLSGDDISATVDLGQSEINVTESANNNGGANESEGIAVLSSKTLTYAGSYGAIRIESCPVAGADHKFTLTVANDSGAQKSATVKRVGGVDCANVVFDFNGASGTESYPLQIIFSESGSYNFEAVIDSANNLSTTIIFGSPMAHNGSGKFNHWSIGDIQSSFLRAKNAQNYSAIYGATSAAVVGTSDMYEYTNSPITGAFCDWHIGKIHYSTLKTEGASAFIFGVFGLKNSQSCFNNWRLDGIDDSTVTASAYSAMVAGALLAPGAKNVFCDFSVGSIKDATLSAIGNIATAFGSTSANCQILVGETSISNDTAPVPESSFCRWNFGPVDGSTIRATQSNAGASLTGSGATITVFGANDVSTAECLFCDWHFDGFSRSRILAEAESALVGNLDASAVAFGAIKALHEGQGNVVNGGSGSTSGFFIKSPTESCFCDWAIGTFSESSEVSVSCLGRAVGFGVAAAESAISSFCRWNFGELQSGASFIDSTVTVRSTGGQSSVAVGFGAANAKCSQSSFCDWWIGAIDPSSISVSGGSAVTFGSLNCESASYGFC